VAFSVSFGCLLLLPSAQSNLSLVPHVLCNAGLLACVANRHRRDPQPLYWSTMDGLACAFFAYLALSVYYSELRGVSWRTMGFQMDAALLYLAGRIFFYRRLSWFAGCMTAVLGGVFLCCYLHQVVGLQLPLVSGMSASQLDQLSRITTLFGLFWLVTLAFLLIPRPDNIVILVYVGAIGALGAVAVWHRLGWVFESAREGRVYLERHQQILTAATVGRIIKSYPLTGSGLGTLPVIYEAFRQSPLAIIGSTFSGYLVFAAETGLGGLLLLLGTWLPPPLYVMRRWGLFPNARLRLAVVAFVCFAIIVVLMGVFDADILAPGPWLMIWGSFGVLMSLVMVRDPGRVFSRRQIPAVMDSDRPNHIAALGGRAWPGWVLRTSTLLVLVALQALPYVAATMSRRGPTENPDSASYGQRLVTAVRLFPLLPELWARLADHLQAKGGAAKSMDIRTFMEIEAAYRRAIALNPHEPRYYERLAFLYSDTSNPTMARDTLNHGVRNNPNDLVLRLLLVRELEKAGSLAMSTYHLKRAVQRIAPDQTDLYLRLAELYDRQGMRELAVRYLQYASQAPSDTSQVAARLKRLRERLRLPAS
jgi:hypothetical protein